MTAMDFPKELKYSKDHEWVRIAGDTAVIGITDYAQGELGDIVFVELPAKGRRVKAGESMGTFEAVKAVSDLYSPLTGEVVEEMQYLRELLIRYLAPSIAALRPRQGMALLLRLNRVVDQGVAIEWPPQYRSGSREPPTGKDARRMPLRRFDEVPV